MAAYLWAGPGEPDSATTIRLKEESLQSTLKCGDCLPPGLKVEAGSIKEELDN